MQSWPAISFSVTDHDELYTMNSTSINIFDQKFHMKMWKIVLYSATNFNLRA